MSQICYQCRGQGKVLTPSLTPYQDAAVVLPWGQAAPTGVVELTSQCDPSSSPMTQAMSGGPTGTCNGCGGTGISRACGNG